MRVVSKDRVNFAKGYTEYTTLHRAFAAEHLSAAAGPAHRSWALAAADRGFGRPAVGAYQYIPARRIDVHVASGATRICHLSGSAETSVRTIGRGTAMPMGTARSRSARPLGRPASPDIHLLVPLVIFSLSFAHTD